MKRRTRPKLVHVTAKVVVVRLVKVRAHKRVRNGNTHSRLSSMNLTILRKSRQMRFNFSSSGGA